MSYALLIDDDPDIIRSAATMIRNQGLLLDTASSWAEGLYKFYAYSPDVVISDYNLPGSKMGLALLLEVSRLRHSVRLVLISAYLNESDVEEVRKLNLVDDVVRKTNPMDSARAIVNAVERASMRSDEATDWVAFANASLRVCGVNEKALESLDSFLQANRLGGSA